MKLIEDENYIFSSVDSPRKHVLIFGELQRFRGVKVASGISCVERKV